MAAFAAAMGAAAILAMAMPGLRNDRGRPNQGHDCFQG
jgi:hypothetical protein